MIAYFVHNSETQTDIFYLPEGECFLTVDRARMESFISSNPDFDSWPSKKCRAIPPEEFGGVIALRADNHEVHVLNPELWQQRKNMHLGISLKKISIHPQTVSLTHQLI